MKKSIRIYACENLEQDRRKIDESLDRKDCELTWPSKKALDQMKKNNCDLLLDEIKKVKPNCLIVDMALTEKEQEEYIKGMGKDHFYADTKLKGGFALIEEVLEKKLVPWDKIAILTQFAKGIELPNFVKFRFKHPIIVLQKNDSEDALRLFNFVYKSAGIEVKYVYTLISNEHKKTREKIIKDLLSIVEDFAIKWRTVSRASLKEAEAFIKQDRLLSYKLIFVDLELTEEDKRQFESIKDRYMPPYSVESFSSLEFAIKLKRDNPHATLIYLSESEKRSLVSFLLSTASGDWAVKTSSLTKSLIAILIKLFLSKNGEK